MLVVISAVIPKGEQTGYSIYPTRPTYKNDNIKSLLGIAGVITSACSIPFFIGAAKNKRRAVNLSFEISNSAAGIPLVKGFTPAQHPELLLRVRF